MSNALFIKHDGDGNLHELLARDIADPKLARRLVRTLASSYPRHGCTSSRASWFVDERGRHEIWWATT